MHASAATVLAATAAGAAADQRPAVGQLYEYRVYSLKTGKQGLLDDYLSKAFIPAVKRAAAGPVGVFVENDASDAAKVHVLIVHPSAESVAALPGRLAADEEYRKTGAAFLAAKADDPVYLRIDSSLLSAIEGLPAIARTDPAKPRLFNLRVYESHNERSAAKKVEMFNKGELDIFKRVGLTPVFFASAVVGSAMPNLTYMLVFPDDEARKAAWDKFRADPEWLKLKAIPEYADKEIVSKITNKLLTPTAYSEI